MNKLLRRTIAENIDLVMELSPALEYVRADMSQLEQVLLNLSINASDAMPLGGRLLIETKAVEFAEPNPQEGFSIKPGHYALLSISDTGHGMGLRRMVRRTLGFCQSAHPHDG